MLDAVTTPTARVRREPPRFRSVSLLRREPITSRLVRCTFGKAVLLLAFLLFALGVVAFTAGAVLVAF